MSIIHLDRLDTLTCTNTQLSRSSKSSRNSKKHYLSFQVK